MTEPNNDSVAATTAAPEARVYYEREISETEITLEQWNRFTASIDEPALLAQRAAETHRVKPADEHRMALVVCSELRMSKGKIAVQCCHAAIGAYKRALREAPNAVVAWEKSGATKVCLKLDTDAEMCALQALALQNGIIAYMAQDAGLTQVAPNSRTVLALGPAPVAEIKKLADALKLL